MPLSDEQEAKIAKALEAAKQDFEETVQREFALAPTEDPDPVLLEVAKWISRNKAATYKRLCKFLMSRYEV
ncbi:MAG TPA: hypothetical protein VJA25_00135 [Dehalococcoidia bacterium]|nr:hypothetical protein [Dehalococcoidia bacterium]